MSPRAYRPTDSTRLNDPLHHKNRLPDGADKALEALRFRLDAQPDYAEVDISVPSKPNRWFQRWRLPILLLIASILSMTWAGLTVWSPVEILETAYNQGSLFEVRRSVLANWIPGLLFSLSLTAILGSHELGHYIVTRCYGIRSTPPLFIPFPISPIGTCGAVILMEGRQADRRQIFDIGIAGPLAGMVIAIPIAIAGLMVDVPLRSGGVASYTFGQPILIQMLAKLVPSASFPMQQTPTDSLDSAGLPKLPPQDNTPGAIPMTPDIQAGSGWLFESKWVYGITNVDMNPLLMAAWVGLLVTGLNMIPISQLDGGHVIFGLLGEKSRYVSWTTYFACVAYVIFGAVIYRQGLFVVMLILVSLMGVKHPPSRNDNVPMGFFRQALGWCTLLLPILCIPLRPVTLAM